MVDYFDLKPGGNYIREHRSPSGEWAKRPDVDVLIKANRELVVAAQKLLAVFEGRFYEGDSEKGAIDELDHALEYFDGRREHGQSKMIS
jgi:hypothetical protein